MDSSDDEHDGSEYEESHDIPKKNIEHELKGPKEPRTLLNFSRRHPVITVMLCVLALVIVVLIIVLPLTLIKKKEERPVRPSCPDGKNQPRIDCLPDRNKLMQSNANMEASCKARACCWSSSPEQGGPNCAFPTNYGYRNFKVKEKTMSSDWIELLRMNAPVSFARSDISNLETRIEMQTDDRLRIRVSQSSFNEFYLVEIHGL